MDYKNARVYKILNRVDNNVYVGSTCQPLSKRMAKHRSAMNMQTYLHRPLYAKMREIGIENVYIELLEEYPCENREQLRQREGFYIRQIGTLNACIAGRTHQQYYEENPHIMKQYREDNKDKIKEVQKHYNEENKDKRQQYLEDNKDKINERQTQYHEANKDKINERHRQYHEANKDKINERKRQYHEANKDKQKQFYEDNKERINALRSVKIMCECGCMYSKKHQASHLRSNKHATRVNLQSQPQSE